MRVPRRLLPAYSVPALSQLRSQQNQASVERYHLFRKKPVVRYYTYHAEVPDYSIEPDPIGQRRQ
jgi:hypothetical protein